MTDDTESELDLAVCAYFASDERDSPLVQHELMLRFPSVAEALREFFHAHGTISSAAGPLRRTAQALMQRWDGETLHETLAANRPFAPRRFGEYELIEELGRGGMGVVYRARHSRLNRVVALKMILAGRFASDEELRRFHDEALTAARLEHAAIVPIYEAGEVDAVPYFSMALVEGMSLADRLREGPIEVDDAVRWTRTIAAAVGYAHSRGVIHRDLKPANILLALNQLSGRLEPRITDFGLARRLDAELQATHTGAVLGTPSYMSPEQAAGERRSVEAASDIYSLGAILYALFTGRPPHVGENPFEIMLSVLERDPVPIRSLNRRVPRELDAICLKCLEKSPTNRYASAAELAEDLDRYLRRETPRADETPLRQRLRRWVRREPVLAAHLIALAVVLLIAQGAYMWHPEADRAYHLRVSAVIIAWIACSIAVERIAAPRLARATGELWSFCDTAFLTGLLALLVNPLGILLAGYHVVIAAAGFFFRARTPLAASLFALLGSLVLFAQRGAEIGPPHYAMFFAASLLLSGAMTSYQTWRASIVRSYYEA